MLANLPTHTPASFLFPTGYGTLGYGLPAAIGAKIGNPDRPVVAVLGDGGVMFTVAELATAAEQGLALPVVVVDNTGYGEIRNQMIERGDPVHAVTFPAPDFAALGRAVKSAGLEFDGVDRILLVGGTSRIPLVAEMVREATGRPVSVDAHPKHSMALGAAYVAEARRLAAGAAAGGLLCCQGVKLQPASSRLQASGRNRERREIIRTGNV